MSAKTVTLLSPIIVFSCLCVNAHALIIEGNFSGKVVSAPECFDSQLTETGPCSTLWQINPIGSVASGSFWYNVDIAPPDTTPAESYGQYFTYTNKWVNMVIDIGDEHFDISNVSAASDEMWDVESVSILDIYREPDGFELQALSITDKTSTGSFAENFITKSLSLNIETWEFPIIQGTSLIQEYSWQENGNLLQGTVYFDYESRIDNEVKQASSVIKLNDFSISVRRQSVPEPSSLTMFVLMALGLSMRFYSSRI